LSFEAVGVAVVVSAETTVVAAEAVLEVVDMISVLLDKIYIKSSNHFFCNKLNFTTNLILLFDYQLNIKK